jgi:Tol biopolymer transport system component
MRYPRPVALVAALAFAGLAAPADGAPLRVTFADDPVAGNLDLFTITPSGQGRQKITSGPTDDTLPAISPARDLIVFTRDAANGVRRLFTVPPSAGAVHAIPHTLGGGAPSWSPDGALIAFDSSHGAGPSRIFTVGPAGQSRTALTDGPDDSTPDWSPDSSRIVFARHGQIWTMRADGTQPKKLNGHGIEPAWAPNGKRIAFVRRIDRAGFGKSFAVFVMDANGSHVQQLTLKGKGKENDHRPAWEPNSRHVAYAATAGGHSKIRTILFGGSNPNGVHLTPGRTPAW